MLLSVVSGSRGQGGNASNSLSATRTRTAESALRRLLWQITMSYLTSALSFFNGGRSTPAISSNLSSNSQPQNYNGGTAHRIIARTDQLPDHVTSSDAHHTDRALGLAEGRNDLLRHQSRGLIQLRNEALEELKIRTDYSKQAMRQENQYQRLRASHSKATYRYQLGTESTQHNLSGFEQAMNNATSVINL